MKEMSRSILSIWEQGRKDWLSHFKWLEKESLIIILSQVFIIRLLVKRKELRTYKEQMIRRPHYYNSETYFLYGNFLRLPILLCLIQSPLSLALSLPLRMCQVITQTMSSFCFLHPLLLLLSRVSLTLSISPYYLHILITHLSRGSVWLDSKCLYYLSVLLWRSHQGKDIPVRPCLSSVQISPPPFLSHLLMAV